jgi:pantothenate kinase, type III
MTLGKTFRYQGEKLVEFILSLTRKDKPAVMVVSSVSPLGKADIQLLEKECDKLLLLDPEHREMLLSHGLPSYLSYDRAAAIVAARHLFSGKGCTIVDLGTILSVDFTSEEGLYTGGNLSLGFRTRFKALSRYSRSLPLVDTPENPEPVGLSERASLESGVVSGIIFEMEGYLNLHPENIVVFTGGDANYFAKRMKSSIFVICNLVLMGLL